MNTVKHNHVYTIRNADVNRGNFPLGKEIILGEVKAFILGK